jgi:pyruvate dehydrogenase E2 component (dihydrolipoamide acetyltransferase)
MHDIIMPKLDLDMDKGMVVDWLKKSGEKVEKNEPIVVIESAKITQEILAPGSGTLKVIAQSGAEVPVGQTIAFIMETEDDLTNINEKVQIEIAKVERQIEPEKPEVREIEQIRERLSEEKKEIGPPVKISPLARKIAQKHNIDISQIKGTGPGGRIVEKDIHEIVDKIKVAPEVVRTIPLKGIRKTIAENMVYSYRTAPQVTVTMDVDMTEVSRIRKETEISYNAFFSKAAAKALEEYSEVNSTLKEDCIKILKDINIGIAVATQSGLIVPVIHNATEFSFRELTKIIEELVTKARKGELAIGDVTRGTFTITNLGMFGVDAFTPIITPRQTAILGIGKINEKPVVIKGQIGIRSMTTLSLSFDHRVVDGALAAQFLQRIKEFLENPNHLNCTNSET